MAYNAGVDSKVVPFPFASPEQIPEKLRELAARIEAGEFGEVHGVAWVADVGAMNVEVGFIGMSPLEGPATHLMLAMGMRKLEK